MEALVLCGGFATRLEPITLFVPKPLLPIGGRPILDYIVEDLETTDITRIVISTNKKFEDQFRYWIKTKKASGFKKELDIVVEPPLNNGDKFGAIKGINYAIEQAGIRDDILVVAGDNFYSDGVSVLMDYFKNSGRHATIYVHDVGSLAEAKRFGIVEIGQNNQVKGFQEKPANPNSTLASTGIYAYPKELLARFGDYLKGNNNPDAPGYFLQWLTSKEEVYALINKGKWYDIGTIDTYKEVFSAFNEGKTAV